MNDSPLVRYSKRPERGAANRNLDAIDGPWHTERETTEIIIFFDSEKRWRVVRDQWLPTQALIAIRPRLLMITAALS